MSYLETPSLSDTIGSAVASVLAAAVAAWLAFTMWMVAAAGLAWFAFLPAHLITFGYALLVGFVALLALGLPSSWILARCHLESGHSYAIAGALAGLIATFFLTPTMPLFLTIGTIAGAVGGVTWWRSYRRRFQDSGASHV